MAVNVYTNNFDAPVGWVDQSGNGTGLSAQSVNSLFGPGFQQTFTVETIRIAGNPSYSDPSGTGGAYSLGMLSGVQDDLLSLTFNVANAPLLNIAMDFAGPSSFRVEPNSQNRWSSSSPVGMWAGCI